MTDIAEFLTARWDEDEAIARAVTTRDEIPGARAAFGGLSIEETAALTREQSEAHSRAFQAAVYGPDRVFTHEEWTELAESGQLDIYGPLSTHMARWSPTAVLRDIEAKRKILAEHARLGDSIGHLVMDGTRHYNAPECVICDAGHEEHLPFPCPTVRLLAEPYSDHEAYDETWRP